VLKVLKGGTTGVGPGTSGKSKGGRSSTGVGVDVGEEGVAVSEERRDGPGDACSSAPEGELICVELIAEVGGVWEDEKRMAAAAYASVSRPSEEV